MFGVFVLVFLLFEFMSCVVFVFVNVFECCLWLFSCNILVGGSVQCYYEYVMCSLYGVLFGCSKMDNFDCFVELLLQFDVVGLQEVDVGSLCLGFFNQMCYFVEIVGMLFWSYQLNWLMVWLVYLVNGLISWFELYSVFDYLLFSCIFGCGVMLVCFGEGDDVLVVMIVYFLFSVLVCVKQLVFIGEVLVDFLYVVLMGDFNIEVYSSEMCYLFVKCWLQLLDQFMLIFFSWKL